MGAVGAGLTAELVPEHFVLTFTTVSWWVAWGVMQGLAVVAFCYWEVRQELLAFVYKPGGRAL